MAVLCIFRQFEDVFACYPFTPNVIHNLLINFCLNKKFLKKELSLTSVSASEVVIGNVADKFKLPCQRVHAVTVTVCRRPDSNRRWLTPALKATDFELQWTDLTFSRRCHFFSDLDWEVDRLSSLFTDPLVGEWRWLRAWLAHQSYSALMYDQQAP